MAHFILEYSDNLGETDESIQQLFADLHDAAESTGLFPRKGLRGRAYVCHQYRMADGNPEHTFAHLEIKLGVGRSLEDRKSAADLIFAVYSKHFESHFESHGMALSFEMKELEPVTKFNKNNIADYISAD